MRDSERQRHPRIMGRGFPTHPELANRRFLWLPVTLALLILAACSLDIPEGPTLQPLVVTQGPDKLTEALPSPTAVTEPTLTPSPTFTATEVISPTPTGTPSPTSAPNVVKTPCIPPSGVFAGLWQQHSRRLGCPLQSRPATITDAEQVFQNGHMFWWKHLDIHLVVYSQGARAGTYAMYANEWVEGDARASCSVTVPQGFYQPVMGFGRVWCKLGADTAAIGWALAPEAGFEAGYADPLVQAFEGGYIFRDSDGFMNRLAYVFFKDGTFVRQSY